MCDDEGLAADTADVDACETISLERASATAVEGGASVERTPELDREWDDDVEERF